MNKDDEENLEMGEKIRKIERERERRGQYCPKILKLMFSKGFVVFIHFSVFETLGT